MEFSLPMFTVMILIAATVAGTVGASTNRHGLWEGSIAAYGVAVALYVVSSVMFLATTSRYLFAGPVVLLALLCLVMVYGMGMGLLDSRRSLRREVNGQGDDE
jgi:hypothetical protein